MPPRISELTDSKREEIKEYLLTKCDLNNRHNKLKKEAISEAAIEFDCSQNTIGRIWGRVLESWNSGLSPADVRNRKRVIFHPKRIDRVELANKVKSVPFRRRQTIRSTAAAVGVSTTTIFNLMKEENGIQRKTTTLKPLLSDANKLERMRFCVSKVDPSTMKFKSMLNTVHIDEKWFYMTKDTR